MNFKTGLTMAAAILAAAFWFYFDAAPQVKNYPSQNSGIVAFGDSLVSGVGSERGGGFVALLSRELGKPIVNLGRAGDTTETALQRINEVTRLKPALTIILLGGNDFLRRVPREKTAENLGSVIKAVQSTGSAVVLVGLDAGILAQNEGELFKTLSRQYGTAYVPDILDDIYGNGALMADTIHPNDAGYEIMAERILPVLRKLTK